MTAFSRKTEAVPPAFASVSAADIIRAPVVQRAIPLDLAALLGPYKRLGRLSLRVERVPQRAKLSAGRNNGDGSWSLASDELEGLSYLVPSNLAGQQDLAIRIMTYDDAAASTLTVVSFSVPPWEEPGKDSAAGGRGDAPDPVLHNELGRMQSLFAVRGSELVALRAALAQAQAQKEAELTVARAAWEQELSQCLSEAAIRVRSEWEKERDAARAERDDHIAQAEARAQEKIAKEREGWQSQAEQRLEVERGRWEAEGLAALSDAERRWQREEAGRLAGSYAEWQQQSAQPLAEAADKCATLERALADALVQGAPAFDEEALRGELAMVQSALAACELELAHRRTEGDQERERWKVDEARRLAASRAEWQRASAQLSAEAADKSAQLEVALAKALAQVGQTRDEDGAEVRRLQGELALAQSALSGHEQELARCRTQWDEERERWRRETQAALQAAAGDWKTQEATGLAAVAAESRAPLEDALATAVLRYENAERALGEVRSQAGAALHRRDDAYVEGLRRDLSALRATLVSREVELGHTRAALDQTRVQRAVSTMPVRRFAGPEQEEPAATGTRRTLVRDFVLVVCLVLPAILFYPRLAIYLPQGLKTGIATLTFGLLSANDEPVSAISPAAPRPVPAVRRTTAIVGHAVNVRATPAAKGAVVLTLQHEATVTILQQRGNWTLVEVAAKTGKPQQGWVFSSYLKSKTPAN